MNDGKGNAVTGAKATLFNPDKSVRQESSVGSAGKFSFENLSAGSYVLRVDKAGYAPVLEAFNVAQDAKIDRGLTLTKDAAAQASGTQSGNLSSTAISERGIKLDAEKVEPKLLTRVQPTYPAGAKAAGVQGEVIFRMNISKEGIPQQITVVSSPSDELAQSALEAVRQWQYSPAMLDGHPVEVRIEAAVNYTLTRDPASRVGGTQSGSSSSASTPEKVVRVGAETAQAKLVNKVQPIYPAGAKAAGVQGKVILDMVISSDGVPKDIAVVSSPSEDLSESALEAVRQWRYSSTLLNGQPVAVSTEVTVSYTLAP